MTFTSGATEANMLVLTPALETAGEKRGRDELFVSAIEHPSVRCGGRFAAEAVEELARHGRGCCGSSGAKKCSLLAPSGRLFR